MQVSDLVGAITPKQPDLPENLRDNEIITISYIQRIACHEGGTSLRRLIKTETAVRARAKRLTYERLVRLVAEQIGLSHEATLISPEAALLVEVQIAHRRLLTELLQNIGWLVIEVAERALVGAHKLEFKRTPQSHSDGNFSWALELRPTLLKAQQTPILEIASEVYSTRILIQLTQDFLSVLHLRHGETVASFEIPTPQPDNRSDSHIYAVNYSSRVQKINWLTPSASGMPISADIGWIDGGAFSAHPAPNIWSEKPCVLSSFYTFSALLSSEHLKRMSLAPRGSHLGLTIDIPDGASLPDFP